MLMYMVMLYKHENCHGDERSTDMNIEWDENEHGMGLKMNMGTQRCECFGLR
jgi:hypothetical protein